MNTDILKKLTKAKRINLKQPKAQNQLQVISLGMSKAQK